MRRAERESNEQEKDWNPRLRLELNGAVGPGSSTAKWNGVQRPWAGQVHVDHLDFSLEGLSALDSHGKRGVRTLSPGWVCSFPYPSQPSLPLAQDAPLEDSLDPLVVLTTGRL